MAAVLAVGVLQAVDAAIPGVLALWNAITQLHQKNPGLTAAQVVTMAQTMSQQIGTLDADTLATLAQIPSGSAPASPAAPASSTAVKS
jgi:hypothetical protein